MTNEDAVVRLLTELRDQQREDITWRRKVTEESMRMQRTLMRRQRLAILALALFVVVVLSACAYLSFRQTNEVDQSEPEISRIRDGRRRL